MTESADIILHTAVYHVYSSKEDRVLLLRFEVYNNLNILMVHNYCNDKRMEEPSSHLNQTEFFNPLLMMAPI